jgi:hypothetical protein
VAPNVVSSVIKKLESVFGKMTVTRGREHTFLSMHGCFTDNRAIITIKSCLAESIQESGLDIVHEASTPARKNLFEVDPESPPLDKKRAKVSHSVLAELLYVATRACLDILLSVGSLCLRVSKSTAEDEAKLK